MRQPSIPDLLRAIAAVAEVKQTGLGRLIGVSQSQISRYLKGAEPKRKAYDKIMQSARRYQVFEEDVRSEDVAASLPAPPRKQMAKVVGYVGAGGQAHYYAVDPGDLGEIEAPERATPETVAVVIIGRSLGKFFHGWYVFYDDVRSPVTDDLIGELCVVGLDDDRILIKKIQRARDGSFDLISNSDDEPPIRGVAIEWAAKVLDLRRG